jgi:phosphoglycolate phosphatase-like HAD superfamily hydrolase
MMIQKGQIDGPIWIKDADTFLELGNALEGESFVATFDIRKHPDIASVGGKSFAVVNEQNHVVDIIEKSVCSNYVSAGLYGFSQAVAYVRFYEDLQKSSNSGELFVSHVISQAIAHGDIFTNVEVQAFIDVGMTAEWRRYCAPFSTYLVDLDGVVFHNQSKYFEPLWEEKETPIKENVDALLSLKRKGAQLIFLTARPEKYREKTATALNALGLVHQALIMDCLHGKRFLINDFATTNAYPSAISINLERNSRSLKAFLPESV